MPFNSDSSSSQSDSALREANSYRRGVHPRIARKPPSRRTLSCFPCRKHKLRCDRHVPCHTCIRYSREDECRQHPSPASLLGTNSASLALSAIAPGPASNVPELSMKEERGKLSTATMNTLYLQLPAFLPIFPASNNVPVGDTAYLSSICNAICDPHRTQNFWRSQLMNILPSQAQCSYLVNYYLENINWCFHAIHVPSFQRQYSAWSFKAEDSDLIWLALVFTIISTTALMMPMGTFETIGLELCRARQLAQVWHLASRQALHAGEFESKPCVMQLQVFLVTQLYWLETKNVEELNSALGQTVRHAQALGLDRHTQGSDCLDSELRKRIWCELCVCDTFQSMCLDRTPLIHTPIDKIPLPQNCNDTDITETSIHIHPVEIPTDTSATIGRASAFRIFRKLYNEDSTHLSSYEYTQSIDQEIQHLTSQFPWYFQNESHESIDIHSLQTIAWQHEMLHICICQQRIRMNRPFLQARIGESWNVCAQAAQEMLLPYRRMREPDIDRFRRSQKFIVQGYQAYTAAVTLAAFLLVERSFPGVSAESMRQDIEMVISDLEGRDLSPMISDGVRILQKMLDMFERWDGDSQMRESLVHEIASVFGGEHPTRKYLRRCEIGYVLNEPSDFNDKPVLGRDTELEAGSAVIPYDRTEPILDDFHLALDMLDYDQWWDFLIPEGALPP